MVISHNTRLAATNIDKYDTLLFCTSSAATTTVNSLLPTTGALLVS